MSSVANENDDESSWLDIDLDSLSLVVAWRQGTANLDCATVPITVTVADELRGICREVLARLDDMEERRWDPDALNESDEYLLASIEQLGADSQVLQAVQSREFKVLKAKNLPKREFLFYALIVGPLDRRVAFVRKYNVRRGLGQRLVTIFDETLTKVDSQIFTFDNKMDVVIDPGYGAAILGLSAFRMLFRTSPEMLARTPEYVAEIASNLPMGDDTMATLSSVALGNMSVQRRLQSIVSRGHLQTVSMSQIKREMKKHGLDVDKFVVDGKLVFDKADAKDILKLLNEDLFRGGLTNQDFQVDRKSPR